MYFGGTDEKALYMLVDCALDYAIEQVFAGSANKISIVLQADNFMTIQHNGEGVSTRPVWR